MTGKPAARKGDAIKCPVHGDSTLVSGSSNVLINGRPAAREGDECPCGDTLSTGFSTSVFINGKPAALQGSGGGHGGLVIGGSGNVNIGGAAKALPAASDDSPDCYRGHFQLIDQMTGKPIAGRRVRLLSDDGWDLVDTTDAEGCTVSRVHRRPETLYIALLRDDEA
ncbi:PAAR domain-containing protein [Pseudomonas sp. REB1044]|uniref:PAAR domain-containing protein n=1 Tax=Pseudomonas sp. REB1044 TaxID=2675224 RepID=UPI00315DAF67